MHSITLSAFLALGAAMLCVPSPSVADNVQEMLPKCEKAMDNNWDFDAAECFYTLQGVADIAGLNCATRQNGFNPSPLTSIDQGDASYGAEIQIFINWAKANPKQWRFRATLGMIAALSDAFPCPHD